MKVITIGRSSDNTVIINDDCASRHHCQITQNDNGSFYLLDRNSSNGTFLNGRQVSGEVVLNPSDVVRIGNTPLPWQSYFTSMDAPTGGYGEGQGGGYTPPPPQPTQTKPNNFLAWSILCTIFCCWPFGIPAIVNAAKVDKMWNEGNYTGAQTAARNARKWFWWSFALGLVGGIIATIYYIAIIGLAIFGF